MTLRSLFLTLLVTASPCLVLACGGGDDDDDAPAKTPATCAAICAQQNSLCNTKDDCDKLCSVVAAVLAKNGCDSEAQEVLDCLSAKNVCDLAETACPSTSLDACHASFCAANATDPLCAP